MDIKPASPAIKMVTVDENQHGQRIDNCLITLLKGIPKSRLYKALRKGEVRVNKKRVKPEYRLQEGDIIRLPPLRVSEENVDKGTPHQKQIKQVLQHIIYEDNDFIVLNKPAGLAVHGGSGINFGVIELLRAAYPKLKFLELVHRLDRETSGCLLIAKKSSVLKEVHALLTVRQVTKTYLLLVAGRCQFNYTTVNVPLQKNVLKSGERIVVVNAEGKPSKTEFSKIKTIDNMTLLQARPITGRTHQIRVHAAYLGHPIIGDVKYGNEEANKEVKQKGVNQLCLHSRSIEFYLQSRERTIGICGLLKEPWAQLIK